MKGSRSADWRLLTATAACLALAALAGATLPEWPAVTQETKPWTRWWWMGNAVTPDGLTAALTAYHDAGLGGVEITPIYGVRGAESRFIPYLSPDWMRMLDHSLLEARRLDLGVDMATGTGWPFGGPWVGGDDACRTLAHRTFTLKTGERLSEPVRLKQEPLLRALGNQVYEAGGMYRAPGETTAGSPETPVIRKEVKPLTIDQLVEPVEANKNLQALALEQVKYPKDLPLVTLMAFPESGEPVDLTKRVGPDGSLDWVAPTGTWTLHALFLGWHGKLVERAGPGGEGNVIDHFSSTAIRNYLAPFDRALGSRDLAGFRAFFNDSYEVDDATGQSDWSAALLDEFQRRRGYDLRRHLPALLAGDGSDVSARVLADYRETISDLLLDTFTREWHTWAVGHGRIVRNQAHGSPASILDLYAASEIPETEGNDPLRIRWATSAAHVAGRKLVAAETATWLGEHFRSTLADVRTSIDRYFLNGVNHIVYHGTTYSPPAEPWPGWLFYAAVQFNPSNSWWTDFGALNQYVTRVQSFLQSGRPDQDVLVYYPLYDSLARPGRARLMHFGGSQPPAEGSAFEAATEALLTRGYAFDFVSDRLLHGIHAQDKHLVTGGVPYQVVVLPAAKHIPLATFDRLLTLAREGGTVAVYRSLPADVSGLGALDERRKAYRGLVAQIKFREVAGGLKEARLGKGLVILGDDLESLLAHAGVKRETLVDKGLQCIRRRHETGRSYFLANTGDKPFTGWVPLETGATSVVLFDPMTGGHGFAASRPAGARTEVFVQLGRGETTILATSGEPAAGQAHRYYETAGPTMTVGGPWTLRFVAGGPERPSDATLDAPGSWTALPGAAVKAFSGTVTYGASFPRPPGDAEAWRLDLGRVHESASVRLNGRELGTLIGPDFTLTLENDAVEPTNILTVSVSNLMANRIVDLERRGVPWKKFYNVNFPSRLRENRGPDGLFTPESWAPLDSGLLGPVTLAPLRSVVLDPR